MKSCTYVLPGAIYATTLHFIANIEHRFCPMLNHIQLDRVLFLDIETVPLYPDYSAMPDLWQELWNTLCA